MAEIATQGVEVLISGTSAKTQTNDTGAELVSWIVGRITPWEDIRDRGNHKRWQQYWRLWRGEWDAEDKNRKSERSRLIAPALSQAIEATVAEIEESVFSKEVWFDIADDLADQEKRDAISTRDRLLEDFEKADIQSAVTEAAMNAAIFGTGIIKLGVELTDEYAPQRNTDTGALEAQSTKRVYVCAYSIRPDEFIPDPAGKNIEEMLGCAHRQSRPLHAILEKIEQGVYLKSARPDVRGVFRTAETVVDPKDPNAVLAPGDAESVDVIEYHGKVPLRLLEQANRTSTPLDELLDSEEPDGDGPLVEAIVTIANKGVLLRAMQIPFVMKDRSIIAWQFEKVPGRFWGRGVGEKGFNPQKALDAELRARQDALGFISAPMVGVDAGRMPRGFRMEVKPGKVWLTQGNPSEVVFPFSLGDLNAATFNQTQEMERMVQMATGAFDTATPLSAQSQSGSNAASTNSGLMGAFVKRAKRAVRQLDRKLLQPFITKSLWRYMQFDPQRYPRDYDFVVKATLGIVAREVENMQLTQVLGMLPEQVPGVAMAITQGIVDNSSLSNKGMIVDAIAAAMAPPPPEQQQRQQALEDMQFEAAIADAEGILLKNQKTIAEIRKLLAEAESEKQEGALSVVDARQEQQRIGLQAEEIDQFREQNRIALQRLELQSRMLEARIAEMGRRQRKPTGE